MVEEWRNEFAPQMHSNAVPIKTPRLFGEIQHFINDETIVVVDAGGSSYWSPAYLELAPENQALYPRGAAAIGSALPMALGAQLAAPDKRVICISGDGGFGYNIMELETAVRLNLPVVNIIVNNHVSAWNGAAISIMPVRCLQDRSPSALRTSAKSPRPLIALGPGRNGPVTFVGPLLRPWHPGDRPLWMC